MPTTTDRDDPRLREVDPVTGQQAAYLVLSEEERARGFVRPVRRSYAHVGERPRYPLRDLTAEECERYARWSYSAFEAYPPEMAPQVGRYWTSAQLAAGCGAVTTMARDLAETYARDPGYYGSTWCVGCHAHRPVAEFRWVVDGATTDDVVGR